MEQNLLVRVLVFMAVTVTIGWFITFVILPAARPTEYQPNPNVGFLMGTIFTGLSGSLAMAAIKARKPRDDDGRRTDGPESSDDDTGGDVDD